MMNYSKLFKHEKTQIASDPNDQTTFEEGVNEEQNDWWLQNEAEKLATIPSSQKLRKKLKYKQFVQEYKEVLYKMYKYELKSFHSSITFQQWILFAFSQTNI